MRSTCWGAEIIEPHVGVIKPNKKRPDGEKENNKNV